jgi:hypothetical protein
MAGRDVLDAGAAEGRDLLDLGEDLGPAPGYSAELGGGESAGQVRMLGPAGRVAFADPAEVEGFREMGYEVEDLGSTIERARGEGLQDAFGGAAGQIEAGARGLLRGATFGGSDVLLGEGAGDALLEANPLTSTVSEVVGAVAPSFLSGGTGLLGSVSRLTPAGLVSARGAQFVARGGSLVERAGRAALAGAGEGALQGVGDYVGRQALRGEAVSGDALAAAALRGGLLGGVAGGAFQPGAEALQGAAARVRAMLSADGVADDVGRGVAGIADDVSAPVGYGEVLPGKLDEVDDARRGLLASIDEARARPVQREIADVVESPVFARTTAGDEGRLAARVRGTLQKSGAELERAASAAQDWGRRYSAALDAAPGDDVAARALNVPRELDDEGAVHLALLDEARAKFDATLAKARRYVEPPRPAAPEASPADAVSLPVPDGRPRGLGGALETGLGALETADDLGLNVPSLSKLLGGGVVGEAVGWIVKLKAGARAARRLGVLPATPAVKAASEARTLRSRIEGALGATARRLPAPSAMGAARIQQLARDVVEVAARGTEPDRATAHLVPVDGDVHAQARAGVARGIGYLAAKAPRNPLRGTPYAARWNPSPLELRDFERRVRAVADPAQAVERVLADPTALLELEALTEVYPTVVSEVASYLAANADRLARELSEPQRQFLGYGFGVPLSITQVPGYGQPLPPRPAPTPRLAPPSNANASPLGKLEQVERPGES